jgi:hypothetical protein
MANLYSAKKVIGVDDKTGLSIELRATDILIEPKKQMITVSVEKCLVSPTGIVMEVVEKIYFTRTNKEGNMKFDTLQNSAIGVGITQMLGLDLEAYPDLEQL